MTEPEEKIHRNIDKMAVREALQEWLDKKWDETCLQFGRWSLRLIGLAVFFAFIYLILWMNGWHK